MPLQRDLRRLVRSRRVSFSVGVPGVLAEFHWVAGEPVDHDDGALAIATARGALRVEPRGDEGEWEADGVRTWWLPSDAACRFQDRGLAEIGPDAGAIQARHRGDILFDLGLALGHVRACVRSADPALVAALRGHVGEDILARGSAAMATIKHASPQRVFMTRMARIEVYQPIPARDERTPDGPHTHVLPHLLGTPDAQAARLPPGARAVLTAHGVTD